MMILGEQVMAAFLIATCLAAMLVICGAVMTARAKGRAALLVSRARRLMAVGIYDDVDDQPGPAKLLGEAYRLQCMFNIGSQAIGLRDDTELDELINRAIRGNPPFGPSVSMDFRDAEPTQLDLTLGDRIAAAQQAENDRSIANGDEYLELCARLAANPERVKKEDLN